REFREDASGAGCWRGGTGQVTAYKVLGEAPQLHHTSQKSKSLPQGFFGAGPGDGGRWVINEGTPEERAARVRNVLEAVGLDPDTALDRRPFQFSGGQCQRISIARALISEPSMLICDEPVSALDVSIQAQIINLIQDMRKRYDLTMLFISHDLSVVKIVCDRVAVMYLGRICELTDSETLYRQPAHPYTAALLSAIPEADPSRPPQPIAMKEGELPSATHPPSGCRFNTRCPRAREICTQAVPQLVEIAERHTVACHFPLTEDT
ncbi:MAG: ATP-binding cassette domain-containing protein, partial [Rhodospirillaceae bacterium]|nr:ATP-binding cassette domain-containing protein [Rhodospirillaceae bacterium]